MASLKELNPIHHIRHGRTLTGLAVAAGVATGAGLTGSTIGLDGSVVGKGAAITLGDGEAHHQATGRDTTTFGINNIGLNFSSNSDRSTARIGVVLNHRTDGPGYNVKIEKKQAAGNLSSPTALPSFKELGYKPRQ